MKPLLNRNREIPEMGEIFNPILFKRKIADLLRKNEPNLVNFYADEVAETFPEESRFVFTEVERLIKQRIKLLGIDFKFDDYRTPDQRQFFYEGLSNEPSMREKTKDISQRVKTATQKDESTPLSGPDVRYFG